ncbi:winged helix family transcriptional regulator [Aquimarina sp. BL5]|uniref:helix-turn-helix domain-containing protein n=1 Tax=Aquimarina sp. BL5 TaxID=1714860 RepID=UPI000E4B5B51|nr:helix-turn-helix domain-containing protein [Aquimarina sp. BL5]AXT49904.1 winged helix family transcriptional regulator [Aquimarina sp. BL5]RKM97722.1 winged helix family transcriptional regulator [Aquimarina sp. BL5]
MKELSKEEKIQILQDILDSREFSKSPSSKNLLRFLTEATISKKQLKETTIGMEIFGKRFIDQNNSSSIRVNIYNLRKKLEKYYENEGKNRPWKLTIDKGQYYISFLQNKTINNKRKDYKVLYKVAISVSLSLLMILGLILFKFLYHKPIVLWDSFFNNNKETTLVVGDFFGFMAKTKTGRVGWNRDYQINSLNDFYSFQKENPEFRKDVIPANYSYVTEMGSIAVYHLTKLFYSRDQSFSIRFSTKSTYNDIKEHNSVYIGPTKNHNKFIQYFNERNSFFSIQDRELRYKNVAKNKDTIFDLDIKGTASEYAIVSRLKGTNGTEQFLFFSDHDMGVIATVELFCDEKKAERFITQYVKDLDTFTALFMVNGKERTNLDLNLIVIDSSN